MGDGLLKITNWNLEWQPNQSKAADLIRRRIRRDDPDIICLTEAYLDFFGDEGHVIASEADYGYPLVQSRRKVLLWSKKPWQQIDNVGHPDLPSGRFIAGVTTTPIGDISVIGICVPWEEAHVRTGRRDRTRWEDHLTYLTAFDQMLRPDTLRTIVTGDFNQIVPRKRTPQSVYAVLDTAILRKTKLATAGPIAPLEKLAVDHVAHTADMRAVGVEGISDRGPAGEKLSDHFGVHVRLSCAD